MKKINKNILWIIIVSIVTLGIFIPVIVVKSINVFKPSFYSYSSYADKETIDKINEHYTYKEYGDVDEFEYALGNNKALAGITSDYSIISSILENKVAPIRLEIETLRKEKGKPLALPWEQYFTQSVIDQMNSFNKYLTSDVQKRLIDQYPEYGPNYTFKFSDFVVPYFINDRLIAYDTKKLWNKVNLGADPFGFNGEHPTFEVALQKLGQKQTDLKIQWTKNERENVVIGSTLGLNTTNENDWNTEITDENYQTYIDNFAEIVKKGSGAAISDTKRNLFDPDSDVILNNLINPHSDIQVTVIYNGDALDAYYGNDNFQDVADCDRVRIIRTKHTVRILDAFIVSSSTTREHRRKILSLFDDIMFDSMLKTSEEFTNAQNAQEDIYVQEGILRIFDYVNYTPAAKGAYEFIREDYFTDENGELDMIAIDIYDVPTTTNSICVKGIGHTKKETLSKITTSFQKKLNGY